MNICFKIFYITFAFILYFALMTTYNKLHKDDILIPFGAYIILILFCIWNEYKSRQFDSAYHEAIISEQAVEEESYYPEIIS